MVAEIWESRTGSWFGQLVEERTGVRRSKLFEARSRGGVIAYIDGFYHQAAIAFRDRLRPTEF
ncbi:MAG TPA: hypothetical protein VK533_10280 [Sphingomonas sp.]|jgi:hypothetical protein|uniref:hypothetical protein n=1 Tax=Sphingomonas sp. TaxID=28214 RepID=UPI002C2F06D8|nr:hypothetical protein [Sphingomonas sp.]HMI19921.1 hypothetical protein [Sphingomonas sp.]